MGINISRKISVKSIVTPELKEELGKQMEDAEVQVKQNITALNERLLQVNNEPLRAQIQNEIQKMNFQEKEIQRKKQEIESLEFGQEFLQGQLEAKTEIELGDNLFEKLTKAEIVVNNGEVIEFRNL
ncbi:MAG: hypothetical protein C0601_04375 [Candidatus Muiribacterium halophilum]|uniref:16S rRNA processing protein RimM n=1 Tax=Muiribacterium halophilum TaxID=2053465 RepID=A0A2N5ZIT8_MUIH1|nr:MAG: hypothetical protein C0601_04375 [Candidatus Muirbacterium halophilum]